MITKRVENGVISVLVDGQMQIRRDTVIEEDGTELSRSFFRFTLAPSLGTSDITDPIIKAIANIVWTPEIVAEYIKKNSISNPLD